MRLHPLFSAALLLMSLALAGCYPPRVETTPAPAGKVDVKVDATTPPSGPKKVEVDVRPGGGVNVEVKPKP